mgnify:CR=1 FL=1
MHWRYPHHLHHCTGQSLLYLQLQGQVRAEKLLYIIKKSKGRSTPFVHGKQARFVTLMEHGLTSALSTRVTALPGYQAGNVSAYGYVGC